MGRSDQRYSGLRHLAHTRNPEMKANIEIPGSTLSRRPGMTV
jgi:hypothetical protein